MAYCGGCGRHLDETESSMQCLCRFGRGVIRADNSLGDDLADYFADRRGPRGKLYAFGLYCQQLRAHLDDYAIPDP